MEIDKLIDDLRVCADDDIICPACERYDKMGIMGGTAECASKLLLEAAAGLEAQQRRIAGLEEQRRWIPVTERLPEHSGEYLVFRMGHQLLLNYSERHRRFNCFDWYSDNEAEEMHIDGEYWRDLPEPPKEVE